MHNGQQVDQNRIIINTSKVQNNDISQYNYWFEILEYNFDIKKDRVNNSLSRLTTY